MKAAALAVAVALSIYSHSTVAQYRLMGVGLSNCGDVVKAIREKDDIQVAIYLNWVAGYLGGLQFAYERPLSELGGSGSWMPPASLWIEKFCAEKPLSLLYDAATALAFETIPNLPARRDTRAPLPKKVAP